MKQPQNSKLTINQNDETLEIFFPLSGFRDYMAIVGFVSVIIVSFPIGLLAYGIYVSELQYKIICTLFSIPFLAVGVLFMWIFIGSFFSKSCIFIDSEKIIFTWKFLNSDINQPLVIHQQDIKQLKYEKRYESKNVYFNSLSDVSINYELIISTQTKEHSLSWLIPVKSVLSVAELEWLANKISNRLGLPIIRE